MSIRPIYKVLVGLIVAGGVSSVTEMYGAGRTAAGAGDPVRGESIFDGKGGCLSCHRVADQGSRLGPDLSTIGTERTLPMLEKAVFDPDPEVQPQNRRYRVETKSGKTITGKLLNQDLYSVQMLDSEERLLALSKADLREYGFVPTPPMPSYRDKLNASEKADLLAYLTSLKGVVRQ